MADQVQKKSLHCPNCGAPAALDRVRCDYCRSVLSLTACSSCFGPVFKGMKFCPACGHKVSRTNAQPDKARICPRCDQTLTPVDLDNTRISECLSCGGIWLDKHTFQTICHEKEAQEKVLVYPFPTRTVDVRPEKESGRMYIACPECAGLMQRKNFVGISGVIVDWCADHGTWFDYRELQKIVDFIQGGGLQKARSKKIERLQHEQLKLKSMQANHHASRWTTPYPAYDAAEPELPLLDFLLSAYKKIFR